MAGVGMRRAQTPPRPGRTAAGGAARAVVVTDEVAAAPRDALRADPRARRRVFATTARRAPRQAR